MCGRFARRLAELPRVPVLQWFLFLLLISVPVLAQPVEGDWTYLGNRLTMKYEDGSLYGTFQVQMAEPGMILTGVGESKGFALHCQRQK